MGVGFQVSREVSKRYKSHVFPINPNREIANPNQRSVPKH